MTDTARQDAGGTRRRARRGDAAIYWEAPRNEYVGALSLGFGPDGKRKRRKVYGKTKAEVRRKLQDVRRELDTGVKSSARYTVEDAAREWLRAGLKDKDAGTVEVYRQLVTGHIIPGLGKRVLRDLTADDVDRWLDSRTDVLATSVLTRLLGTLRRIIRQAQRRDRVVRNVAELTSAPKGLPGRPSKALSMEQAAAVLKSAKRSSLHAYIVVSLLTGVRTEEARALLWENVDLDGDPPFIAVWRSVREGGDTKTKKSRRTLALPPMAVDVLREHRARQDEQRRKAGALWREHGLVCCTRVGTPYDSGNVRRIFRRVVEDAGLPPVWTPREMRHSFVSLMSEHGVPVEEIARLVGHSTTATTEQVYRKELRPVLTRGADVLSAAFAANTER